MSDITDGFAKYVISLSKDDESKSVHLISEKLKEIINAEIDSIIDIVKTKETEWGEVSIRVNRITNEVIKQISAKKI